VSFLGKKTSNWLIASCFLFISTILFHPTVTNANGSFVSGTYEGKTYKVYVPSSYDSAKSYPLYVMLHGCGQDAEDFSIGTKMNSLSEAKGFLVLYPEQNTAANANRCWNWFDTAHQSRGSGEPNVIAGMVNQVRQSYSIKNDQIYVSGLSAGGAMSVIMGATYPDIFSGVGVVAGLEYKAATSALTSVNVMVYGGPYPIQQGILAYNTMGSRAKHMPVIVFQGALDNVVYPINARQVISQWAATNDLVIDGTFRGWIDNQPDHIQNVVPVGKPYTINSYKANDNKVWMKSVLVQNMWHAWPGGSSAGSYTDPLGPDASAMMVEFFQTFITK